MGERKIILVLSGEICTGKSTISDKLEVEFGFKHCKTRNGLNHLAEKKYKGASQDRDFLQKFGEELDSEGGGKWVLDYFQEIYEKDFATNNFYVIDSARILKQIQHLRSAYSYFVYHVHLTGSPTELERRFYERGDIKSLPKDEQKPKYTRYKANATEAQVNSMASEADLVIDTDRCNDDDVFIRVASFFRLLAPTRNDLVDVIVGGQFGSEGKGQIAAHISPEYDCLMRVGGPNAGHTVFEKPSNHVFHLLP